MSGSTLGIIEMTLSGVIALSFCAYQVWKMDREIKKDKAKARAEAAGKKQQDGEADAPRSDG